MSQDLRNTPTLGINDATKYSFTFIKAVAKGDVAAAEKFIELGVNPNLRFSMQDPRFEQYDSGTERAERIDQAEIVLGEKLFGYESGYKNITPIVLAQDMAKSPEMVGMLISHGAEKNVEYRRQRYGGHDSEPLNFEAEQPKPDKWQKAHKAERAAAESAAHRK